MTQSFNPPPPQAEGNVELKLFLYLSAFSRLVDGYFIQTQSLPKLSTLDHSLVYIKILITTTIVFHELVFNLFIFLNSCGQWTKQILMFVV